ncbi:MAG: ribosomal L7Ae/L30e/S12e/Gadd45 family protein [Chitinophagales bacterium]
MSLEALRNPRQRVIGLKQTTKVVERGQARTVYVAKDAEERLVRELLTKCQEQGVDVIRAESMAALGKACGIDVGAAAVALTKSD